MLRIIAGSISAPVTFSFLKWRIGEESRYQERICGKEWSLTTLVRHSSLANVVTLDLQLSLWVVLGYVRFPWENRKFRLKIKWFGKLQKISAVICGCAIFLFFSVCSANLDVLCSGSFPQLVKFYSFKFVHKIPTRVVCVNVEHPRLYPVLQLWGFCGFEALYPFLCTRFPPGWFVSMVSTPGSTPYFSYEAFAGVKHYTLFMHNISTRVACVNGERSLFYPALQLWGFCGFKVLYPFLCTRFPPGWFVSMVSSPAYIIPFV